MSVEYVDLSRQSFAFWWLVILAIHLATCGYNTIYAIAYWDFASTYLYGCLKFVHIGMPAHDHHIIAIVNLAMAATHAVCVLLMVGGSLWHRRLVFIPRPKTSKPENKTKALNSPRDSASRMASAQIYTARLYSQVLDRQGLLGVNGANFYVVLLLRELVETSLQTVQAYRMSWLLPRASLNHFFVSLLVINCWSSVFLSSALDRFRLREARRRFASILLDCILDLVSFVGIPLAVVHSYIQEYNPEIAGFDMEKWYDDEWTARMLNEIQMVVVVSWSDLFSRTVFSLGVLFTTTSLKELLRRVPDEELRGIGAVTRVRVAPKKKSFRAVAFASPSVHPVLRLASKLDASYTDTGLRVRFAHRLLRIAHLLFGGWGVVVLSFHIQASLQQPLAQCALQVRPWGVSEPACFLAVLDCHRLGISGQLDEVESKWREFDRATVVTLLIRHCPDLHVPDLFTEFHQVVTVKLYNSTISSWEDSAAITNTNHPNVLWLYMARVNMTDGVLPAGLQSADFPRTLQDIELCYTNLQELPEDLDKKWLIGAIIFIEYSQLSFVPPVLIRLQPYYLGLNGNPIGELPPAVLEVPNMMFLGVSDTYIHELPRDVVNLSPALVSVFMTDVDVDFFWSWIDPLVERNLVAGETSVIMGRSTYCTELANILSGTAKSFRVLPSAEYATLLMDPSTDVISRAVSCDVEYPAMFYPITIEDSNNQLV